MTEVPWLKNYDFEQLSKIFHSTGVPVFEDDHICLRLLRPGTGSDMTFVDMQQNVWVLNKFITGPYPPLPWTNCCFIVKIIEYVPLVLMKPEVYVAPDYEIIKNLGIRK